MVKLLKYSRRLPIPTQNEASLDSNILLAVVSIRLQRMVYKEAPFKIHGGIHGSTFAWPNGFHVIMGSIFLIICVICQNLGHFTHTHPFVDVVCLFSPQNLPRVMLIIFTPQPTCMLHGNYILGNVKMK
jgi:hypothetical protein